MLMTPPEPNAPKPDDATPPGSARKKRWTTHRFRWRVRLLLGIPVAIVLIGLLLMRSPLVGWVVASQLRALTGCELKGSGAYIDLDGRLILRAFDLVLPEVPGDAGKLLSAQSAVIELDWSNVLSGTVRPTALRLDRPIFRVSQSLDDGTINMSRVASAVQAVPTGGPSAPAPAPPRIDALDGVVVLGEHTSSGAMSILREVPMSGSFMPVEAGRPVYALRIGQSGSGGGSNASTPAAATRGGMIVDGKVDLATGAAAIKLYNFQLDQWYPESVPSAYRDLWSRLAVQGRIASASLGYDPGSGVSVDLVLDDVSMNALIPAEETPAGSADAVGPVASTPPDKRGAERDLALQGVSGTIGFSPAGLKADLSGRIEGQAGLSKVRLETVGTDRNAALRCEIRSDRIALTKEVGMLPYMPERAKRYLRVFGGPTGEIDAQLTILRAVPINGQPAPVEVRDGRVVIRNGSAAFHKFPYPFSDMHGVFEFNDTRLKIVEVTGRGPSGATLRASGLIEPLTDEAMVEVTLRAENLPTDDVLLTAMPPARRKVLQTIFSAKEHQRLLDSGLIRLPGTLGRSDPTATLEPEFPLGGRCTVDVHILSPKGKDSPWFTTVDVAFAEAGVVPEPFPLPILVRGLKMHITDEAAEITAGQFIPVAGGTLDVSVKVLFEEDGKSVSKPDVRITGRQVPIDRTLMHALPESLRPGATPPQDPSLREASVGELLRRLNLSGALDVDARIMASEAPVPAGETPDIDYRVAVDLSQCVLTPSLYGEDPAFSIENLRGEMEITPRALRMFPLSADLIRKRPEGSEFVGPPSCASFAIKLETLLEKAGEDAGRMDGIVAISRIELTEPIERLISVFSPQAGIKLGELRKQRRPSGRLNSTLSLYRAPGPAKPTSVALTLDTASNIEVDALGGRLGVDWPEGVIGVALPGDGPESLSFEGVRARLTLDAQPCGDLTLSGPITLDTDRNTVAGPADLRAQFGGWSFESPLIEPVLKAFTGERTAERFRSLRAAGLFDATLAVRTDGPLVSGFAPAALEAELRPTSLAFERNSERIVLDQVEGGVTLRTRAGSEPAPVAGRFDGVRVRAATWSANADGTWSALAMSPASSDGVSDPERPVKLDLRLGVEAERLTPDLRALMPSAAQEAVAGLDAEFRGPLTLADAIVKADAAGGDTGQTSFSGELRFKDLAFNVGVPIEQCDGRARMDIQTKPTGAGGPSIRVDFESSEMRAAGVLVRAAQATVASSQTPGVIEAANITAQCHGGRVTARATVTLPDTPRPVAPAGAEAAPGRPRYDAQVLLAGVRLAPVLSDFAAAGATDPGPVGPPNPFTEPDPSRGKIDARLTVRGVAGDLNSRTGEGAIRISEGDVLRLPVMLPLIQVSNLQLPSKDRLSYMQSEFLIDGPAADFHQISLLSDSIAIVGTGTLTWPQLNLNMRFTSKGRARVPLLSDIFDLLRDEIVSTTVSGKLAEPVVRVEPFTGTRQMLDDLFGPSKRRTQSDIGSASEAARREMNRLNESAGVGTTQSGEP
ncbi:MAG: hypothetical protein K2W85_08525 [Phycisphaerales bacterium]|nr:hypothetical protein [Phycisphaerales bacterium]